MPAFINGALGRILTCMDPLRRRCLIYSSHESFEKWRAVPVLPRPRGVLETLLRCWRPAHDYAMAAAAGFAPTRTGSEPVMLLLHHAAVNGCWGELVRLTYSGL